MRETMPLTAYPQKQHTCMARQPFCPQCQKAMFGRFMVTAEYTITTCGNTHRMPGRTQSKCGAHTLILPHSTNQVDVILIDAEHFHALLNNPRPLREVLMRIGYRQAA